MKRPFKDQADREKVQNLLDYFLEVQNRVTEMREMIHVTQDAEEGIDGEDCTCIADELDKMDATFFAVGNVLHVYGCQLTAHAKNMDIHDVQKDVAAKVMDKIMSIGPDGIDDSKESIH